MAKRNHSPYLTLLVVVPLLIGLLTFRDYGESVDENQLYLYSDYSLHAYQNLIRLDLNPDLGKGNFRFYGPSFLMSANLFARTLTGLWNSLSKTDAWHLAYFLSFCACGIGMYFLARRWFTDRTAFTTATLFLFQPLLWGHAFINPKDIPFMSFFLLCILAGLRMQERLFPEPEPRDGRELSALKQKWGQSGTEYRKRLIGASLLIVLFLAILALGQSLITKSVSSILSFILASEPESWQGRFFSLFARNYQQTPMEAYLPKGVKFVNVFLMVLVSIVTAKAFVELRRVFSMSWPGISRASIAGFFKRVSAYLKDPHVLLAAAILGLTASIRILGLFPGLVLLAILLYRNGSKIFPVFFAYFAIALLVLYVTWPYLWSSPISNFMTSLAYMSDFPWPGKVLFNGSYYTTDQLPVSYIPVLLGIQFTEPVVVLFVFGTILFAHQLWNRTIRIDLAMIVFLLGILPLLAFIILRPALYDNTRQILFVIPGLFLIVAVALEKMLGYFQKSFQTLTLIVLLIVPGVYSIVHLHPYEYTYYNSFVHGLSGSYRRFESDYMATSFREAVEYLNQTVPQNAKVLTYGPGSVEYTAHFSRPDLHIDALGQTLYAFDDYQYAIISTRNERDLKNFTDWETLYVIQRDENVFALVKQRP